MIETIIRDSENSLTLPELPAGLVLLVEAVAVTTCVQGQELAEGVGDLDTAKVIRDPSESHPRIK